MQQSGFTAAGVPLASRRSPRSRVLAGGRPDPPDDSRIPPADACPRADDRTSSGSSRAVLWIDDQVEPGDASVRLLTSEGFHVDCAASAAEGLGRARSVAYDAIILDLRLPDTPGLALLESLRAAGVSTPVLVLTGYGDLESAVAALRLGVIDFQRKPLMADELVAAIRSVASAGGQPAGTLALQTHTAESAPDAREPTAVRALLARFDEMAAAALASRALSEKVVAVLLLAVESPASHISTFLACAEALRHVLGSIETTDSRSLIRQVRHLIARAGPTPAIDHRTVRTALERMEAALGRGVRPAECDLAAELGVDAAHLGRLIRLQTGCGFRQWRSAFAIRLAVRELADREAQIAQVAFRVGYEHPSQLDREFRRLFGVSPREYRRLRRSLLAS